MASRRAFNAAIGLVLLAGGVIFVLLLAGVDLGLIAQ